MYLCGIPLNTVTLAALVVVLGMIVDNSIVVIDGYLDYIGRGHSRWYAAVESAREFFPSLLLATICICMIFYPILFTMTGMMRDFLTYFPWTITINLMVSLLLAVLVVLWGIGATLFRCKLRSWVVRWTSGTTFEKSKVQFSLEPLSQPAALLSGETVLWYNTEFRTRLMKGEALLVPRVQKVLPGLDLQEARKVREDTTIERPARKISMTDGYTEEKKEEPETQSETTGEDKPAEPSGEESKE